MLFDGTHRRLLISPEAVEVLMRLRQQDGGHENGGILLGRVYPGHDEILRVTTPTEHDKRSLFGFVRSRIPAQRAIDAAWKQSQGTLIYLGEWHTHLEIGPRPSRADRRMIRRQLKTTIMEIEHLYLVIVGSSGTLWAGRCNSSGLKALVLSDRNEP